METGSGEVKFQRGMAEERKRSSREKGKLERERKREAQERADQREDQTGGRGVMNDSRCGKVK